MKFLNVFILNCQSLSKNMLSFWVFPHRYFSQTPTTNKLICFLNCKILLECLLTFALMLSGLMPPSSKKETFTVPESTTYKSDILP